jgi:L-threonylcarbamoyladenylate synthase
MAGNLVAFPTETVYGLGADASNQQAVARIYEVKGRPTDHPLIVHVSSIDNLDKWAKDIPEYAVKLARAFWPGPMTLILPRTDLAKDFITGGQNNVGIRVPAHSVALALLKEFESQGGYGIAAPSANRFGKVSPTCAEDVYEELSNYLSVNDLVIDGSPSIVGVESTIINCTKSSPLILRPGGITSAMINDLLKICIDSDRIRNSKEIKVPGLLDSHYAPNARVFISGVPQPGDGLIALNNFSTPEGVIRLANPINNEEFARVLYNSFRLGDNMKLANIYVIPPIGNDIGVAIRDRLQKATYRK